jgi:Alpha/beta hydrolase domain
MPRIEVAGDPAAVVRDHHGIARGGIRLPDVEVPLATLTAETASPGLGSLSGSRLDFDAATVASLYPDRADYLKRYDAAIDAAVSSGYVLARDAEHLRDLGRSRTLPS